MTKIIHTGTWANDLTPEEVQAELWILEQEAKEGYLDYEKEPNEI